MASSHVHRLVSDEPIKDPPHHAEHAIVVAARERQLALAPATATVSGRVVVLAEACAGDDRLDCPIVDHLAGDEGSDVPTRITNMHRRKTT